MDSLDPTLRVSSEDRQNGVRILLQQADDVNLQVQPAKTVQLATDKTSENASHLIGIVQTTENVKAELTVINHSPATTLCNLYFEPTSDRIALKNTSSKPITIQAYGQHIGEYKMDVRAKDCGTIFVPTWELVHEEKIVCKCRVLPKPQMMISYSGYNEEAITGKRPSGATRQENSAGDERDACNNLALVQPAAVPSSLLASISVGGPLTVQKHETVFIPPVAGKKAYSLTLVQQLMMNRASRVFCAHHSGFPRVRTVAKIMRRQDDRSTPLLAEAWLDELEVHRGLNHDRIVKLHDYDARFWTLILEFIPGNDLSKEGTREQADPLTVCADIASALMYLHGQKLVHNDIKPENILYCQDRGAVLCDFGLATRNDYHGASGTPWYIAIEFPITGLQGEPSDMWALGVTMLYLSRLLPLPSEKEAGFWLIRDTRTQQSDAQVKMSTWLGRITRTRDNILHKLERGELSEAISGLLATERQGRVTAANLAEKLSCYTTQRGNASPQYLQDAATQMEQSKDLMSEAPQPKRPRPLDSKKPLPYRGIDEI